MFRQEPGTRARGPIGGGGRVVALTRAVLTVAAVMIGLLCSLGAGVEPAVALTQTIYPSGLGVAGAGTWTTTPANSWATALDADDDASTMASVAGGNETFQVDMDNAGLGTATINSVTVFLVGNNTTGNETVRLSATVSGLTGGSGANLASFPTNNWNGANNTQSQALAEPNDGTWTGAEVDALAVNVQSRSSGGWTGSLQLTQLRVVIDYTPAASNTLSVTSSAGRPVGALVGPGTTGVGVDGFVMQRTAGATPITVTSVTVGNSGTAPATNVSSVSIYRDNGNGTFVLGEEGAALGTAAVTGANTTVGIGNVSVDGTPVTYWVVYNVASGATDQANMNSLVSALAHDAATLNNTATRGPDFTVDAVGPSALISAPGAGVTLTGGSAVISGTANDGPGVGVATVSLRIKRTQGASTEYYNGSTWVGTEQWFSAGNTTWTYTWSLPSDDGLWTYEVSAKSTDLLGQEGAVSTVAGLKVDNVMPQPLSAIATDPTHVSIQFSELLDPATVDGLTGSFSVPSLTVASVAVSPGDHSVVNLTTSAQTMSAPYEVIVGSGVTDVAGNPVTSPDDSANFTGYAPASILSVSSIAAQPSGTTVAPGNAGILVDGFILRRTLGTAAVAVSSVTVNDSGETPASNVSAVRVYADDGNGSFGAEDGAALGSSTFSGDNASIDVGSIPVDDSADTYWVVYDISGGAIHGSRANSLVSAVVHTAEQLDLTTQRGANFTVDAEGPSLQPPVVVVDSNTIRLTFDEAVTGVAAGDFSIVDAGLNGLAVLDATLLPGNTTVELTTEEQQLGISYTVTVAAGGLQDGLGNSNEVASAQFFGSSPGDTTPPTPPATVEVTPGASAPVVARISWSAATDNVGVTLYRVWRSTAAGGPFTPVDTTSLRVFDDTTGQSGVAYYYAISAIDAATNESVRSASAGPVSASWTITSPHAAATPSTDQCAICHSLHDTFGRPLMRKLISDNTGQLAVCYYCHDGTSATDVKAGPDDSFALASGHFLENTDLPSDLTNACAACHNPHRDETDRPKLYWSEINGKAVTGNNRTWCLACHDDDDSWYSGGSYPALSSPVRNVTGYPTLGTFPGASTYNDSGKNAHSAIATATPSLPAGDCRYCHASHRGTNEYDGLTERFRPSSIGTVAGDRQQGTYAELCFGCHGGDPDWVTAGAADIKRHATYNGADDSANSGHRIRTPGGNLPVNAPLPCYDCHQPHGSGNPAMLSDELGSGISLSSAAGVRKMCFGCHSTADNATGWDSGLGTYAAVGAETFEGLPRNGALLRLPSVAGHNEADGNNCYSCHGNDYGSASGNNVHNPGLGASAGGIPCFSCHAYQSMQSASSYHHYMSSDDTGYATIADPAALGATDSRRTCLMCHVDHDYFDSALNTDSAHTEGRAQNLRSSVATEPSRSDASTYVNFDFYDAAPGDGGICVSCHKVRMTKNTTGRKSDTDRSPETVPITRDAFAISAHNYLATAESVAVPAAGATFTADSSGAYVNCVKCHNDSMTKAYQTGPYKFGMHDSSVQSVLTAAGQPAVGLDPQESECYLCHSRTFELSPNNPNGGSAYTGQGADLYGGGLQMAAMMDSALNVKGMFNAGGSSHPVTGDGVTTSRVECTNCHNVHQAEFNLGFGGPSGVVQDPDNTLLGSSLGGSVYYSSPTSDVEHDMNAEYCLKCHDGTTPAKVNAGASYIPYDVYIAPAKAAQANKSTYRSKSHFNAVAAETAATALTIQKSCGSCHDKHGSSLPKLLGTSALPGADPAIEGVPVTSNNNGVCAACHLAATATYPFGEDERRSADGYPMTGTWPGTTTYDGTNGIHKAVVGGVAGTSLPGYSAGDCKTCHDVHGTQYPYDELRLNFGSQNYALCLDCHDGSPAVSDIKSLYPVSAGGTATDPRSGHRVLSDTSGVTGATLQQDSTVPCYDCHNPHGSASQSGLQVRDIGDADDPYDLSTGSGVREFCLSCHLTSDSQKGWDGAAYASVVAGVDDTVEGIPRNNVSFKLLLPDINEHKEANGSSCLGCHLDVHQPFKPSNAPVGGLACYQCHTTFRDFMDADGTNKTDYFHHALGTGGGAINGDTAFAAGAYPAAGSAVYCLSCHVDHDKFNGLKAGNLRADSSADPVAASTDFPGSGGFGVCVSCHSSSMPKDSLNQKSDGLNTSVPIISGADFRGKAHDYGVNSSFVADSSVFSGNCVKCHDDEQSQGTFQAGGSAPVFRTHYSAERRLLSSLGAPVQDPLGETHCYGCHSGDTADNDFYGVRPMGQALRRVRTTFTSLTSNHPVDGDGVATSRVECVNCHNAHEVSSAAPVSDPNNTYNLAPFSTDADKTAYCLKCHDGTTPTYVIDGTTYVPSTVLAQSPSADKSSQPAGAHWSSSRPSSSIDAGEEVTCAECHDKHGSNAPKLLGVLDPADGLNKIGSVTISANNNSVCTGCHQSAQASYPSGESNREASTGYITDGTWPGYAMYSGGTGIHKTVLGGVAGTTLPGYSAGDCKTCHEVHGTAQSYDELRLGFASQSYALCFDCHDGSPSTTVDIKALYPVSVGGTSSDGRSGHRVLSDTSGLPGAKLAQNAALPCYDCHNPHGSASPDGLQVRNIGDTAGDAFDLSTAPGVRKFCFACHLTSDTHKGWNGTGYAAVISGTDDTVEGIPRDNASYDLLLVALDEHREGDGTDCLGCHVNTHKPSGGGSNGGVACYSCHKTLKEAMDADGTSKGLSFHHVLGTGAGAYNGGTAFAPGSYPAASTDVYCMSCHVDHDKFNASRSGNLRSDMSGNPTPTNTDFNPTTGGVCLGCHDVVRVKDGSNQLAGGSAQTPVIGRAGFAASKHNYTVDSTFKTDSTAFQANCLKCHDDEQTAGTYQLTRIFGLHFSSENRLLKALDALLSGTSTQTEENLCYKCHTGGLVAGTDGYGVNPNGTPMTATSRAIQSEFGKSSVHPVGTSSGLHKGDEGSASNWNPSTARHVECEDCHNPHESTAGVTAWPSNTSARAAGVVPPLGGANVGVWGITFNTGTVTNGNWSGKGTFGSPTALLASDYTRVASSQYQWQMCLKCHTRYGWGSTPPNVSSNLQGQTGGKQTDVADDLNPMNYAVHPVFAPGKNQPGTSLNTNWTSGTYAGQRNINGTGLGTYGLSNTFTDGWLTTSRVVCSDCHRSDSWTAPSGPHGSNNKWLLSGVDVNVKVTIRSGAVTYPNSNAVTSGYAANFCVNCHRKDIYGSGNPTDGTTDSVYGVLSRFNHDALNTACGNQGRLITPLQWSGCLNCHGGRKDANSYNNPANTVVQSGAIHGTSMTEMSGSAGADPMGYRFMNGASWAGHTLSDASGTSPTCYTLGTADNYSSCTAHSGGRTANNSILYSYPRPTN